jgi:hypothetical protein
MTDVAGTRSSSVCAWVVAVVVGLSALSGAFAGAAHAVSATPTYDPVGTFGSGPGAADGQFTTPAQIAVEPGTGNVLVADAGNGRVDVFAPDSALFGTFLTSIPTGGTPYGLAVDQSTGAVYVSNAGSNDILRYTSDGAATPTYTVDPSFVSPTVSPAPGPGADPGTIGSFAAALAVDPTSHDLLVADPVNLLVDRYTSTGAFVRSFDGSDTAGGAFVHPIGVAAGTGGTTYVVDGSPYVFGNQSRLERFSATGSSEGALDAGTTPGAVAVDPASGRVVAVGDVTTPSQPTATLYAFDGGPTPVSTTPYPAAAMFSVAGALAIDGGGARRLYAVTDELFSGFGQVAVQVFDPAITPGVEVTPPTQVLDRSAHLTGTIDTGGATTTAHFEYSANGGPITATPDQAIGGGAGAQPVGADATGLTPDTTYTVRLVAVNAGSTGTSAPRTFTTAVGPPDAVTGAATDVEPTSAFLNGQINPFGAQSSYHFEYGPTTAYGMRVPAGADGVSGNGRAPRPAARAVTGLAPGTVYHFRIVGTNASGSRHGDDATFTTPSGQDPSRLRAYEQVTPVDKHGGTVDSVVGFQARPDGNAFVSKSLVAGSDVDFGGRFTRTVSLRAPTGWSSGPAGVPVGVTRSSSDHATLAVSDDFSKALVASNLKLTPQAIPGGGNLFVKDLRTETYTFVAGSDGTATTGNAFSSFAGVGSNDKYYAGAPDFSWIVFASDFPLTPEATAGIRNVYRWTPSGGVTLESRMPGGAPAVDPLATRGLSAARASRRLVSDDGSTLYFGMSTGGLYVRRNGETTAISVPQDGSGSTTAEPGTVLSTDRSGRFGFFSVASMVPLTADAPSIASNVYRYDARDGSLRFIAANSAGFVGAGDDGETAYVYSASSLTPDSDPAIAGHFYVWHDGTVRLIADAPDEAAGLQVSPDGRYFAFTNHAHLTSYDNTACNDASRPPGQCLEVFLYDAEDDELECASCPLSNARSTSAARLPDTDLSVSNRLPQAVTDRGEVFFDTATPLVLRDVNGERDVYAYRDGIVRLISPGTGPYVARFADASVDGSTAFFTTAEALVQQDRDASTDVYAARVGGGITGQTPTATAPCAGPECVEGTPGPVASSPAGSQSPTARASRTVRKGRARISVVRSSLTPKALHVTVKLSERGRIRVSGARVRATVRTASRAGTYTLVVPLGGKARTAKARRDRVKISVKASLTPPFGAVASTKLSRTLGK